MEIHRLISMQPGYDKELFNRIYKETENLRKSLTFQIDPRRYGVTKDIIESWFDDKFIFVFNKYYSKVNNDVLKGMIINALKVFKFRVLRKAYSKFNIYEHSVSLDGELSLINIIPLNEELTDHELFLEMAIKYLKSNLCDDAFLILNLELNPPPYILYKIKSPKTKIPAKLIAEYLDMEKSKDSISYVNDLRSEINFWVNQARVHFNKKICHNQ